MEEGYLKDLNEIYKQVDSTDKGLTKPEAEKRLQTFGKNELEEVKKFQILKILYEQFNSFLIYILLISSIIMFYFGNNLDAIVIFVIVLLNSGIGFFQQYKAETAIKNLKKFIIPKSRVLRAGKLNIIPSSELVPGDLVLFEPGDKITADCRIISCEDLQTIEAVLTGESEPVSKSEETLNKKTPLAMQTNMLFAGTQIVRGTAKALVVETGMKTEFGKIAKKLQEIETQKTPMQKKLDIFSKQLGFIILLLVAIIFIIGILKDNPVFEMFMVAVTLAIGAIPEGLPAVLALSFSISSMILSKQNVIIRRLPAVEALGSVTVICSDKTGTMTEEEMSVQELLFDGELCKKEGKKILSNGKEVSLKDKSLYQLLKSSVLCNNARLEIEDKKPVFFGDPTEVAFVRNAYELGINKEELTKAEPTVKKFEFESDRMMMSKLRSSGRNLVMYSKGSPEKILSISTQELIDGQIKPLTKERKKQLMLSLTKMETNALRVLAFAYKNFNKKEKITEEGLIFLGFIGMMDPPRKEIKTTIVQTINAGISVKMITGDSEVTARAVANKIGILGKMINGSKLDEMSDSELVNIVGEISIFARTTPNQKLRITKALQAKGEIVAITGDGINDVLALKSADIGIAMGKRGTDVARDVSDIVLIDDNFVSLIEGVKQGRRSYDNIKKFTKYMLAVNFSTIFLVGILSLLGFPLPITPLQILWMNLITDSIPAISLVMEKGEEIMKTKPRRETSLLSGIWKFIVLGGLTNFIVCLIIYFLGISKGLPLNETRTMVLTTGILFELFFVYTCRSDKSLTKIGIFSNKWLNYSIFIALGLHLILLYSFVGVYFDLVKLTLRDWLFVLPFGFSGLFIFEFVKFFRRENVNH